MPTVAELALAVGLVVLILVIDVVATVRAVRSNSTIWLGAALGWIWLLPLVGAFAVLEELERQATRPPRS
jgi:hypothetical protein